MIRARRLHLPMVCLLVCLAGACGENGTESVASGPCPGESGFGARVAGASESPVDVCVDDDVVVTRFTYDGWYDVTARMTGLDGTVYEFQMLFPHHTRPRALNVTDNLAEARADPSGAWFSYQEFQPDSGSVESAVVVSGTFQLGFSDTEVVAGLFENVRLEMQAGDTHEPAGTRTVLQGFFSILTDESE